MVLLMLFAAIYCVLQLVVVATPARSLRFSWPARRAPIVPCPPFTCWTRSARRCC